MAHHIPNRRGLTDEEIHELDDIQAEYMAAQEQARQIMSMATARRNRRILDLVEAAGTNTRGTQARIVEHLGVSSAFMSIIVRSAKLARNAEAPPSEQLENPNDDASSSTRDHRRRGGRSAAKHSPKSSYRI